METSNGLPYNQHPGSQDGRPDLGQTDQWTGSVKVRVEESCFTVERSLLARCSEYFRALFSCGMVESDRDALHLKGGLSARAFLLAMAVCRGQAVPALGLDDPDELVEVIECAAFLQMAPLERHLCDTLDSDNCVLSYYTASIYGLKGLEQSAAHFLRDAYDDLREEAELNLPPDLLGYVESLSPASYVALGTHSPLVAELRDSGRLVCHLDETAGEWRCLTELPAACSTALAGVAVLDNRLYVVGGVYGYGKPAVDGGFCYDPETGAWSTIPGPQQPRYDFTLLAHEGRLYAVGGEVDKKTVSSAEAYDVCTGAWTPVAPAPHRVGAAACAVTRRRMFMCFWRPPDTTDIYEYEAGRDIWTLTTTMKRAQSYGHCMVAHRDNLYVMRNGPGDDFLRCLMERYNVTTGQWSTMPGLYVNSKGALFTAAVRGDQVFTVKHMLTLVYGVESGGQAWKPRRQMKGFPASGSLWTCLLRLPRTGGCGVVCGPPTPPESLEQYTPPPPDTTEHFMDALLR